MKYISLASLVALAPLCLYGGYKAGQYVEMQNAQRQAIAYGCGTINAKTLAFEWLDRNLTDMLPAGIFLPPEEKKQTKTNGGQNGSKK